MKFVVFFALVFTLQACGNAPAKKAGNTDTAVSCYKLPVDEIQACKDRFKK